MGLFLVDQTADFSASPVAHAGLYTTITGNLQALHEIRRNAAKTVNNSVPGKLDGSVVGAPVFSAGSANVDASNFLTVNSLPVSGGLTTAIIVKNKNLGAASDHIIGSIPGTSATQGACWWTMWNRRIQFSAYDYARPAALPLAGSGSGAVFIDTIAADDGNFELYFGILEDNVGLRLYRPKTGVTSATAKVGRDFAFDNAVAFKTSPNAVLPVPGPHDLSMFAHWSSVLTPAQMNTFYAEMKKQFAAIGLTVQ